MKNKILLPLAVFLFVTFFQAHAQINKGSILLGGQGYFYTQTISPDQQTNEISLTPAIGKAIKDNLVVGIDIDYSHSSSVMGVPYNQTANMFGVGVFLRRYVPLGKGFYVFGQGRFGASYNTGKTDQNIPVISDDIKGYSFDLGFYLGISYQVSKKLQLETGFNNLFGGGFQHSKDTQTNSGIVSDSKTNTFSIETSLTNLVYFTLGFKVLLAK